MIHFLPMSDRNNNQMPYNSIYTIDPTVVNMIPSPPPGENPIILPDYPICPDFEFLTSKSTREMVKSAYKVIANAEGWRLLSNFRGESFMFTSDSRLNDIMDKVNIEYGGGHSGSSIGITMRHMEYIAKNGFNCYREHMIELMRNDNLQPTVTRPTVSQTYPRVTQPTDQNLPQ